MLRFSLSQSRGRIDLCGFSVRGGLEEAKRPGRRLAVFVVSGLGLAWTFVGRWVDAGHILKVKHLVSNGI